MGRIAAVLCSAGCYVLLFPPFGMSWLSWVALVPLLLAIRGRSLWQSIGLGALWGFAMTAGIVAWLLPTLHDHFEFTWPSAIGFWLGLSAAAAAPFHAVAIAVCNRVRSRVRVEFVPLVAMAAWVSAEYLRVHIGLQSPWALMGDAHFESVRLRQIAELGGVYAVSAVVVLGNATLAEAIAIEWRRRVHSNPAPVRAGLIGLAFACVCGASLGFGQFRLGQAAESEPDFEIAIVQGNVPPELRWKKRHSVKVLRRYSSLTSEAISAIPDRPPDLIVWPENAVQISTADPVLGPALRGLSRFGVPLLLGVPHAEVIGGETRHYNSAMLLRESGEFERYDKRRLLPFSESPLLADWLSLETEGELDSGSYTPGAEPGVFSVGTATLGVLICMEALYPDLARDVARKGATLLVTLSNDSWYQDTAGAEQHVAQVVFRAIETRMPMVRAASGGISTLITSGGEIAARLGINQSGVLRGRVALRTGGQTLYTRWGDAFAIACLVGCAAPFVRSNLRR